MRPDITLPAVADMGGVGGPGVSGDPGVPGGAAAAGGAARPAAASALTRRVLVVNPNTNPAVTALVAQACSPFAHANLRFDVVNPLQGPFSIENAGQREEAERQVLALVAQRCAVERHDAYVTACFDDLALQALRARMPEPVIGTCEAGIAAARTLTPRFVIVTTVADAVPGIAAPPPPMCTRLLRSYWSTSGLPNRSITMVGILVQWVTRWRWIKRAAKSRFQRGINTKVAPK